MAKNNLTVTPNRAAIARAIDMNAALRHLLQSWDVLAEPHVLHAQFTAIEACVEESERALCGAEATHHG